MSTGLLLCTSCGVLNQVPPDQAIRLAIAQQQANIRQEIAAGLGVSAQTDSDLGFKIDRLTVANRQKLSGLTRDQPGYPDSIYKVRGAFNATIKGSTQTVQQEGPFEIYLGTYSQDKSTEKLDANKVKTWYLVSPDWVNRP